MTSTKSWVFPGLIGNEESHMARVLAYGLAPAKEERNSHYILTKLKRETKGTKPKSQTEAKLPC